MMDDTDNNLSLASVNPQALTSSTPENTLAEPSILSRRSFLRLLKAGLLIGPSALIYSRFIEPYWLDITHRTMPLVNLPEVYHDKLAIQISDTHIGSKVPMDYLHRVIDTVNSLSPALIFITGDILHFNTMKFVDLATDLFGRLKKPALGMYAVLGNHDYGMSWYELDRGNVLTRELEALGITVLRNQVTIQNGLQIAGIDDYWGPIFHPELVLPDIKRDLPAIVMAHNPDTCDTADWSQVNGWVLSGHTHGGQVKIPFFRPPYLPVKNKRYSQGEIKLNQQLNLYINRGTGFTLPVRFNARPELTCFTLENKT